MDEANRLIGTCRTCQTRARVEYEPGCTFSVCLCGNLIALPDYQPVEVARGFNAKHAIVKGKRARESRVSRKTLQQGV